MTTEPNAALEDIKAGLSEADGDLESQLLERFGSDPLDGQRAVSMLELACYADIQCHEVEAPLREATLAFVRERLGSPDVFEAVKWIETSYESPMHLADSAEDPSGEYADLLVQGMNLRMAEYARGLLASSESLSAQVD